MKNKERENADRLEAKIRRAVGKKFRICQGFGLCLMGGAGTPIFVSVERRPEDAPARPKRRDFETIEEAKAAVKDWQVERLNAGKEIVALLKKKGFAAKSNGNSAVVFP